MKMFRIYRTDDGMHYDAFEGAIVIAESAAKARDIHPGGFLIDWPVYVAGGGGQSWVARKSHVRAVYLGETSIRHQSILLSALWPSSADQRTLRV